MRKGVIPRIYENRKRTGEFRTDVNVLFGKYDLYQRETTSLNYDGPEKKKIRGRLVSTASLPND